MISVMLDSDRAAGRARKKPSNLAIRGPNPPKEEVEETTCDAAPAFMPACGFIGA
jgi:hypothetical protein